MADNTRKPKRTQRRRNRGEDSVYQRASDHRWICEIRDGDKPNGKPNIIYLSEKGYPDTKANRSVNLEARNRLMARRDDIRTKLRQGVILDRDTLTVGQWLDKWLELYASRKRVSTYQSYQSVCKIHIKPLIGRKQLRKLEPLDLQEMYTRMEANGVSATTIRNARAILRKAINDAMSAGSGLVSRNVASLAKPPSGDRFQAKPLKYEDIPRFLEAAKDDRLLALWQTFLMTGIRAGEAYGLRWQDVDLDNKLMTINKQMLRVNRTPEDKGTRKRAEFADPKTDGSAATIPMPPQLVEALEKHRDAQDMEREVAGNRWKGAEWQNLVFCTTIGTPLDPTNTLRAFRNVLKAAKLDPKTRIHDLRHTCGTMLARLGVHPKVAQQILRHSQISTTMAVYTHVEADTLRESVDLLGGLVMPGAKESEATE